MMLFVKHIFSARYNMQNITFRDYKMTVQLIKKLADEIASSAFEVVAIEMTPRRHLQLVHELVNSNGAMSEPDQAMNGLSFMNLPILFVHGDSDYYKLLNKDLHKLRIKHTDLLGIYNEKYNRLKVFISNSYKIENSNSAQFNQTAELESLVLRLNQIEQKMVMMSD